LFQIEKTKVIQDRHDAVQVLCRSSQLVGGKPLVSQAVRQRRSRFTVGTGHDAVSSRVVFSVLSWSFGLVGRISTVNGLVNGRYA
jgi:hypothetical protein